MQASPCHANRVQELGVSQNQGYPLAVPIMRIIVLWGQIWGPLILGNYPLRRGIEILGFGLCFIQRP